MNLIASQSRKLAPKAAFNKKSNSFNSDKAELEKYLEELKERLGFGHELNFEWLPGTVKFKNGKQLEEEVVGNTILIYAKDRERAKKLLAHGFAEWLLNQHTKRYRLLINKLIELFEQIQYEEKEKLIGVITKLMEESHPTKHKNNRTPT